MSIDYKAGVQHQTFTVTTPTAADVEKQRWSKSFQWRCIGMDIMIVTAAATGATLKIRNDTTSTDLVSQDLGTDAADTQYEVRVPADSDMLIEPGEIVQVISTETDAAVVAEVTLVYTRTDA